jgi:hypothetical protein
MRSARSWQWPRRYCGSCNEQVAAEAPAARPARGGWPGGAAGTAPGTGHRQVWHVVQAADGPVKAKDVCTALGQGIEMRKVDRRALWEFGVKGTTVTVVEQRRLR